MTPSDYSQGNSLEHDRMQADVMEWIREHGDKTSTVDHYGDEITLHRRGPWAEVPITIGGTLRGFVDLFERWESQDAKNRHGQSVSVTRLIAFEIKPRLTTIGGLIRQMRAEELLLKQSASKETGTLHVHAAPIVKHNDPELTLLRRLFSGPVFVWNAEERTLS